jgi:hypothetical protein
MAPALLLLHKTGGTETKTKRNEKHPGGEQAAPAPAPAFEAGGCAKEKSRGGRRKSLKRLNPAKEMEGFNLDFLPEKLGFPSENVWISFRGSSDFLPYRSPLCWL